MAEKSKNGMKNMLNFMAFVAVVLIGVCLLVGLIFDGNGGILLHIANAIAYAIVAICALYYAKRKGIAFMITYIIAVVLIVICYIIPLF